MFLKAHNQLMVNREQAIADCRLMLDLLTDCSKLDADIDKINEEIATVSEMVSACIQENATKAISQEEYNSRYDHLIKRYQKAKAKL